MEIAQHIAIVQREGERLASAAERGSLDAAVPTCPGWTVRDLVIHVGGIHRWAATIVREARPKPFDPFPDLEANPPSDEVLIDWFRQGHAELVQALKTAPDDLDCFTVFRGAPAKPFWARRQAHETGMHRVDAEAALGTITPFETDQAVDGIEELLFGFMARPEQKLHSGEPRTIGFYATDAGKCWLVHLSADDPTVSRESVADADCSVSAGASELFQLVWNRRSAAGLEVRGDESLLSLWRESVFVRWR
jgi:uncharacterized protein (TIGR03083 family)